MLEKMVVKLVSCVDDRLLKNVDHWAVTYGVT